MHARYYNFRTGRFLSVDPVDGKVDLSQSWNRYAYVEGRPIGYIDPNGRSGTAAVAIGASTYLAGNGAGYAILSTGALGVVAVAGGVIVTHVGSGDGRTTVAQWWADRFQSLFSKGGRQNIRDTGLRDCSDEDIAKALADPKTPKDQRRRLQREQKARGQRNRQKRDSGRKPGRKTIDVVPLPGQDSKTPDSQNEDLEDLSSYLHPPSDDKEELILRRVLMIGGSP
jgi:hypothetical protein